MRSQDDLAAREALAWRSCIAHYKLGCCAGGKCGQSFAWRPKWDRRAEPSTATEGLTRLGRKA